MSTVPDLTVVYLTVNRMPEKWVAFHRRHLEYATEGFPIVSVSKKPIDIGRNVIDESDEVSYWNVYRQLLRGATLADTPFVAVAEDDTLYSRPHFRDFRPGMNEVAYNRARWSVFAWESEPIFCMRQRVGNFAMIAPREYLIDALTERMEKYPNGDAPEGFVGEIGRRNIDRGLKVSPRQYVEFYSGIPVVNLCHDNGIGYAHRKRKAHGQMQAYEVPYWGRAADIVREYVNA